VDAAELVASFVIHDARLIARQERNKGPAIPPLS
jgi:hypothetical protein